MKKRCVLDIHMVETFHNIISRRKINENFYG
jgi:hypothetical protein